MTSAESGQAKRRSPYGLVFLALVVITGLELGIAGLGLTTALRNTLFVLLSLGKAGLVAAFFMHLRTDSRLYTYILLFPSLLLILLALVATVS